MGNRETGGDGAGRGGAAVVDTVEVGSEPNEARIFWPTEPEREGNPGNHKLEPGDELARWVVAKEIGAGGMGVVYSAHDPLLDRKVAIKLLRREAIDGDAQSRAQQRLLREAQALAKLTHDNKGRGLDRGAWRGGEGAGQVVSRRRALWQSRASLLR